MDPSLLGKPGFEPPPLASVPANGGSTPLQNGFWDALLAQGSNGASRDINGNPSFQFGLPGLPALPALPKPTSGSAGGALFPSPLSREFVQPQDIAGANANGSGIEGKSASPEERSGSASASAGNSGSNGDRAKRTRKRQQTSCSECHRRKQKCNQQVPCDRCIKRGTADACRIIPAGEGGDATEMPEVEEASPPVEKRKRKRKGNADDGEDLAARVQQLENIIRMTQIQNGNSSSISPVNFNGGSSVSRSNSDPNGGVSAADSPSEADFSTKSETSAVEEAAVAALGQLSKAVPNEGGDEARIYNGPGSVMAFLQASAFGKTNFFGDRYRARPADLHLYSGVPSIHNMATPLAGPRMTRLVDALIEHKAKLLPAQVCHYLWNFFYSCPLFSGRSRNFPRGCVQKAYDALWPNPADRDTSEDAETARSKNYPQLVSENSLAFLSYCFVTFAISLQLAPGASVETQNLSAVMYEASRSALLASEQREQPTYAVIGALISHTVYLKIAGCPSFGFTYIAQAIRYGQSMGLHREPGPKWGLDRFEAEIRRRLWWSMAVMDKGHSIAYGRPYSIFERHCDVEMPSNIHERDLTPDGPTNVRPFDEITEQTGALIHIRFSKVIAEVIDRALSCKTPSYSTIIELDALMTKTEAEWVPEGFKNPSLSDLAEKPYLRGAYAEIQIQFCWLRTLLHRPYLLQKLPRPGETDHYAGSRALTIMLAQKILGLNKDALNHTPENLKAYFGFAFNCFEPAATLGIAIMQAPDSPNALVMDQYVKEAIDMLERMSTVNKVALEGHESLTFIREKYLKAVEDATKAPATATSRSTNSNSDPSPVSLAYTSGSAGPSPFGLDSSSTSSSSDVKPFAPANQPESAPTPNTLFNQFFSNLGGSSPLPAEPNDQTMQFMDPTTTDIEKLFNFDPTLYSSDPNATWLTQPIDGGLESWPLGMPRLEGETDFGDWAKMLGF